ncbi:MAG: alpha/beta hydrolase [Candidatus Syntropharchaeales archaeon]
MKDITEINGIKADIYGEVAEDLPAVVLCPPHPLYGGSRRDYRLCEIADTLSSRGITAISIDYSRYDRGMREIEDVVGVIEYLDGKTEWTGLLGYSYGAVVASNAASRTDVPLRGFVALSILDSIDDIRADFNFDPPKFFIHGRYDDVAPFSNFEILYRKIDGEKSLLILDTDHFYTGMGVVEEISRAVAAFFKGLCE